MCQVQKRFQVDLLFWVWNLVNLIARNVENFSSSKTNELILRVTKWSCLILFNMVSLPIGFDPPLLDIGLPYFFPFKSVLGFLVLLVASFCFPRSLVHSLSVCLAICPAWFQFNSATLAYVRHSRFSFNLFVLNPVY